MRWVLAMLVVAMHLNGYAAPHKAYLAVDFFFILSGFVLTGAYESRASTPNFFSSYLIDRIARLYPLHLVTLLVLLFMNILFLATTNQLLEDGWSYSDGRAYTFVLNLLLLQNVGLTLDTSWNAPSWSISVEFVLNIALGALLIHLVRKKFIVAVLAVGSLLSYIVLFHSFSFLGVFTETVWGVFNSGVLRGIGGIGLGVAGWYLYKNFKLPAIIAAPAAALTVTLCLLLILLGSSVKNVDFLLIPIMLLAILLLAWAESEKPLPEGSVADVLHGLGASSYAVYLIHWPIITFIRYQLIYAWGWSIDIAAPLTTMIIVGFIAVCAIPIHYYFELPAKKWTKLWFARRS